MIYAKSDPVESVAEHTNCLLNEYSNLKNLYGSEIEKCIDMNKERFWELLYMACKFHDLGKAHTTFQNIIRKKIGEPLIKDNIKIEFPHNYLSPAFLPCEGLNKDEYRMLVHTIAYHHERDVEPIKDIIKKIVDEDLCESLNEINKEMKLQINKLDKKYTKTIEYKKRIKADDAIYKDYIMMKGLLHRIDHAASAHQEIEEKSQRSLGRITKEYIENKFDKGLRPAQIFSLKNKEENVLLVASTGIGKTESALLWIDGDKAFFTLPLRVSINALFTRVDKEIGFDSTGLLHSSSLDYLDREGYENCTDIYDKSKLLAKQVSFSTIDQVFKFPLKYAGYEKIYATLAYSKIVIDEIQAYSPKIAAIIIKGIEMINEIGGRVMIMTATLPRIYKEELEKKGIKFVEEVCISDMKRHKIKVRDEEICDAVEEIVERGKEGKVIVIVNTVKKALEVFEKVKERTNNCHLLHSMFVQRDRAKYEKKIKNFADDVDEDGKPLDIKNKGIWITTQIVEASLDVDFDFLYTETSTLDSLFQRFGRCYRKREFDLASENVHVFTRNPTGRGSIYNEHIMDESIKMLLPYNENILQEKDKIELVDRLYSKDNLQGTEFYKEFQGALGFLETIDESSMTSSEAQKILREIDSYNVIPKEIYDDNVHLFESLKASEKNEKMNVIRKINELTTNIASYKCRDKAILTALDDFKGLYVADVRYDETTGIVLDERSNNIF